MLNDIYIEPRGDDELIISILKHNEIIVSKTVAKSDLDAKGFDRSGWFKAAFGYEYIDENDREEKRLTRQVYDHANISVAHSANFYGHIITQMMRRIAKLEQDSEKLRGEWDSKR